MCKKSTIFYLFFLFTINFTNNAFAQNSLLINLGSNTCATPDTPYFSIISNPLSVTPSLLNNCFMGNQLPDYYNTFIAYNPKNNKIYINDVRYGGSKIWVLDMGLPNNIVCPSSIPISPDFSPAYSTNNFEFDNKGNLWSVRNYIDSTGICSIDQYDILTGNILASKQLQFPSGNFPSDIANGDLCILPNGRLFATFGEYPSRLYEINNYNDGTDSATATFLQTMPNNTFGIAYLNGLLEVTGTNSVDTCYYFDYNISTNILGQRKIFQNGQAPIDNTSISPIVGATKQLLSSTKLNSNSAELVYEVYVQNMGNVILNNINITEDLGIVFGTSNISNVSTNFTSGFNTPGLTLNSSFNGTTITNLLDAGQQLVNQTSDTANYFFKVQIKFDVTNLIPDSIYNNSAIATANIGADNNLINVTDSSNNGASDMIDPNKNSIANEWGENIPTPFNISLVPVKFISNHVNSKENAVIVDWKIATPIINANIFIIESSIDGVQWQKAGEISIDNSDQSNYEFTDQNIRSGNLFYRIKEVDKNGAINYSTIMKINNSAADNIAVYPNPAGNYIRIDIQENNFSFSQIELSDVSGRILYTGKTNSELTTINTSLFATGTYFLKILNNNTISTQKVLIKH